MALLFRQLYCRETCTYTYLLGDSDSLEAVIIDPVLECQERDLQFIHELGLRLRHTVETHVHADHITGGGQLRTKTGCEYNVAATGNVQGADRALQHGDTIVFGARHLQVLATPGHTSTCLSYLLDDRTCVFTGDALFIRGCGRTDFQEGSAATLYQSIHHHIFSLPDACRIYPGHDYKGRTVSTVAEERDHNPRLGQGNTQAQFVDIMDNLGLGLPAKIHVAVPANQRCGDTD